jgi:hypothetical protein
MMLVTQYILGLKDELQGPVESQLPTSISLAYTYAFIHEAVLERQKKTGKSTNTKTQPFVPFCKDMKAATNSGEIWKDQQL